jgi:hypothetical protein
MDMRFAQTGRPERRNHLKEQGLLNVETMLIHRPVTMK